MKTYCRFASSRSFPESPARDSARPRLSTLLRGVAVAGLCVGLAACARSTPAPIVKGNAYMDSPTRMASSAPAQPLRSWQEPEAYYPPAPAGDVQVSRIAAPEPVAVSRLDAPAPRAEAPREAEPRTFAERRAQYAARTPSASAPAREPAAAPAATRVSGAATHTVAPGDTLFSISRTYGVRVDGLEDWNAISRSQAIRVGQTLKVAPSGGTGTAVASAPRPSTQPSAAVQTRAPAERKVARAPDALRGSAWENTAARDAAPAEPAPARVAAATPRAKPAAAVPAPAAPAAREERVAVAPAPQRAAAPVAPVERAAPAQQQVAAVAPREQTPTYPERNDAPAASDSPSFAWPVEGTVLAGFGPTPDGRRNDGVNIAVPEGTRIRAAEDGRVVYVGNELAGYGNLVLVSHGGGYVTAYAHAKELLVQKGQTVRKGQVVALAGTTGGVSEPQVHFEIRKGTVALDPVPFLEQRPVAGGGAARGNG
ncbi:peptidoglycan DD-metalloendopeptidase family protein [Futiania mangrovi]|uniref:Peptidoglycan DD-metalloendopeptidase family protein n=1 Tax=Futiania mangrovi TaxID=2959716 RepID=A0A9J6P8G9_9PROT|nr:peptidoglycan DD-metalloendopeptidase family protein [Futiania mangrovii]MCP1335972.1 peptidoglycan DD-metalloendopeptidase family protein [Futiania mangrovii]